MDRLSTPHANGRATHSGHRPRYALSDSSASTASQTSFSCRTTYYTKGFPIRLHKGSALGCLPEHTLQSPAILYGARRERATAHHSVTPPTSRTPQASLPAPAPTAGRMGVKGVNGIDREARERPRDARPGLSGAVRHAPDVPDRPHSVLDESDCVVITCFNFAERASLPAGGRLCGMRRKAQRIG